MHSNTLDAMTYHDQDRYDFENDASFRDEQQPRFRDRGQYREGRSFERGPDYSSDREHEREFRGGMRHHASRPYLAREREGERFGEDRYDRQLRGGARSRPNEDQWSSTQAHDPWEQGREGRGSRRGTEGRSFGQSGWAARAGGGEGSSGFGAGSFSPGSYGGSSGAFGSGGHGSYGGSSYGGGGYGAYGGSSYGGSSYGGGGYMSGGESDSVRGGEGDEYGAGAPGRRWERDQEERRWRSSGGGSQESWDGPHAGKGPKGFKRSDERLNEEVSDRLERHGQIDASGIEVTCKDGMVTLRGTVDSRRAKRLAEDVAESIHGVQDVMNELKVQKESSASASGHDRSTSSKTEQTRQESTGFAGTPASSQKR